MIAYFYHKTSWVPWVGLNVKVTLVDVTNNRIIVDDKSMSEVTLKPWLYKYPITLDSEVEYFAEYTCDDANYITSTEKTFLPRSVSASINSKVNLTGVTTSINNLSKKIDAISEKEIDFTDLYGKIDDAISKIESIEIPEFNYEEKEAKKAVKLLNSVAKELKTYIESQNKKEDEIMAITSELNKLDMEDAMEQKQKEMEHKKEMERKQKEEEEENKKVIELLNAEFDKLEEEDRIEKKKELEEELKEKEKEMKEIQKELKSL